jgi:[protein-PII] uridylyltransferase
VRADLDALSSTLEAAVARGCDGIDLARLRAEKLDAVLASHFARACVELSIAPARAPLVLAAAGSYGRGAMALASDVDVRLVAVGRASEARALADAILYPLWDAGLAVGHQLAVGREMLALAREDLATATTLFELRTIAGDARVANALVAKFVARVKKDPVAFARRLADDTRKRHERFGDSVYLLEPDVKLGAGGFRDLEVARWMLACHADRGEGDPLDVLVARGALDPREHRAAVAAEAFAWRVRNRLHRASKRRSDRLTFDAQETLATELGYVGASRDDDEALAEATERFMQDHYVHARAISRVHDRATSVATRGPRRATKPKDIGGGLAIASGAVVISDLDAIAREPAIALRAYAQCVSRNLPIDEASRDAIARVTTKPAACAKLRESAEASTFVALVCTVADVPAFGGSIARELHDVGLLLAMIPEFLPVTGRVHHDVYHVLTVDVHSVAALDCLRELARGERAQTHPLASRLGAEIARPRPLFLATLLHDIGKGHPGPGGSRKNHSVTGADLCDVVLPRLGFTAEETADARALVLHHLAMYHLATRRDLDDETTARELCRAVRGREGLRDLYLLTLADITTTSPAAMTSWKAHVLEELYLRAEACLAGASVLVDEDRIARVTAEVAQHGGPEEFAPSMPMRYVLATPPISIASHARLATSRGAREAVVGLGPAHASHDAEICVVARDRPGLLARIAAALAASRLEVSTAHVSTRSNAAGEREAVDVFTVRAASLAEVKKKLARVESDLVALLSSHADPGEWLATELGERAPWAARRTPDIRTKVVFDQRASPRHTIIEVFAKDQPGLLFRLARALEDARLSITLSKINTEGTKVADVFYVQELEGRKIEDPARLREIHERLIAAVR